MVCFEALLSAICVVENHICAVENVRCMYGIFNSLIHQINNSG